MLHITLGYVIHADRQREIAANLRRRRLLEEPRFVPDEPCSEPVVRRLPRQERAGVAS